MKKINKTLEKLKKRFVYKSIRDDLEKPDNTTISEESRRVIQEMGNMELFELGQISKTYSVSFLPEARARGTKILWVWRLSPTR